MERRARGPTAARHPRHPQRPTPALLWHCTVPKVDGFSVAVERVACRRGEGGRMGALFDAMMAAEAKRASAKRKPSIVDLPEGGGHAWRPDTKTRKAMGWGFHGPFARSSATRAPRRRARTRCSSFFAAGTRTGRAQSLAIRCGGRTPPSTRESPALEQTRRDEARGVGAPEAGGLTRVRSGGGLTATGFRGAPHRGRCRGAVDRRSPFRTVGDRAGLPAGEPGAAGAGAEDRSGGSSTG